MSTLFQSFNRDFGLENVQDIGAGGAGVAKIYSVLLDKDK